ncbi:fructosamine kinase family protein [Testudinibacter sp. TR-2022]|uniref:fructosamine kinase family protein n=1 Tax=Testudinibacter sp. TR-2022 TaxID=2585029 RepID=UPI00111B6DE4|nr:fructosamine kinase family protein [Testudinibacter sp. TR-2022]TNH03677.1 fructosamine kinase family protein [Pasteurellaceae bacterium Phil31]TNH08063.1 fructosamine kinase family protein [Testudinibacter sp. TR-2022]TNH10275.1 fructosamine kinase family protein [Testudinibacter sp. TR-2022]
MWKAISQLLADQFGSYYTIKSKTPVAGGEMHQSWIIDDGNIPVFVKINDKSYRSMFRTEADQLELLAKSGIVRVPRVYALGCAENVSFILMESLDLQPIPPEKMAELAAQLATLHTSGGNQRYGFDYDTWLGPVYQPNSWAKNWSTFFSENRIGWQLQLCKEKNIHFGNFEDIISSVSFHLAKYQPTPALLHGAFYHNNMGICGNEIVLYDPACYWGDAECDLALADLFDDLSPEFYQAYNSINPIDKGYQQRKTLYQLYYLLNFSHRFRGQYIQQADEIIRLIG